MKSIPKAAESQKTRHSRQSTTIRSFIPGVHRREIHRAVIGREASLICFCCEQRIGFGAEYYRQQAARGVVAMHRVCPADPFFADVVGAGELAESVAIGGLDNG